jgi:hypothetical protein
MSKDYGLSGVGGSLELAKGGPKLVRNSDILEARDHTGFALTNFRCAAGSGSSDAVNKGQLDAAIQGLDILDSVKYATTADLGTVTYDNGSSGVGATLTRNTSYEYFTPDGTQAVVGQRILVKTQSNAEENGIYVVTEVGNDSDTFWVLTRATDYDEASEVTAGDFTFVEDGAANAAKGWVQTEDVTTMGTDSISWTQFSSAGLYTAGDGMDLAGSEFSVDVTDVIDTDYGLTEDTNNIRVNLESDGGLAFDGVNHGVEVKPDSTTGATVAPLTVGSNGAGVTVDNTTIEHTTGTLSAKDSMQYKKVDFTFETSSPFNIGAALPAGADVIGWMVQIDTSFDGTTPTLSIGDAGDDDKIAPAAQIDLETGGLYVGECWADESSTQVIGTLTLSGASQGAGSLLIKYAL